jgi:hypothetical protein
MYRTLIVLILLSLTGCTFADGSKWPWWYGYYADGGEAALRCDAENSDIERGVHPGQKKVCARMQARWIWDVNQNPPKKETRP